MFKSRSASRTLSLKEFRLHVTLELIGAKPDMPKRGRKRDSGVLSKNNKFKRNIPTEIRYDKAAHLPKHLEKPRRCALFSTRSAPQSQSRWSCSTCDVGLCLNDKRNCFATFHTKYLVVLFHFYCNNNKKIYVQ